MGNRINSPSDDNWFEKAAREAENSTRGVAAQQEARRREAMKKLEDARAERLRTARRVAEMKDPRAVAAAAAEFKNPTVYSSGGWIGGAEPHPARKPTADEGLQAIIDAVRKSPDPFIAAGEWMSKATNALAEVAREYTDE